MKLNQQCPQTPVDLALVHASSTEHKFEWYSSPMPLPSIVYLPSTNTHNLKVKTRNQNSLIKLRKKKSGKSLEQKGKKMGGTEKRSHRFVSFPVGYRSMAFCFELTRVFSESSFCYFESGNI